MPYAKQFRSLIIRTIRHKGLRRLIEANDRSGLPAAVLEKILKMIFFMQEMETVEELRALPSWKPHQLAGDRKGTWALHVTKNWRLTFRLDADAIEIYEDYY